MASYFIKQEQEKARKLEALAKEVDYSERRAKWFLLEIGEPVCFLRGLSLAGERINSTLSLITNPEDLILGEQNYVHYSLCDGIKHDWQRKRDFAGFGLTIASLLEPGVTAIVLDKLFDPVDNVVVHFDGWTFNINVCFLDRLEPSLPEENDVGLCDS